jgi:hypothetical protein
MEIWRLFLSPSLLLTSSGPPSVVGFESRCPSLSLPLSLLSLSLALAVLPRDQISPHASPSQCAFRTSVLRAEESAGSRPV